MIEWPASEENPARAFCFPARPHRRANEMTVVEEIMQAALTAPDDRKNAALRVLRGEPAIQPAAPQTEPYLTLTECGRRLGISPCTLWRWAIPGHQFAGRRKFRMSEVEAYLASDEFRRRVEFLKEERAKRP